MPIFEFRCKKCGHVEEVLQKYDDPAPDPCPACGAKKALAREVSLTSFQLKGGGWYKDLYSSVKKDDKGGGSGDTGSSDTGASTDKADKKPAAKEAKKAPKKDPKKPKKTSNG